MKQLNLTIENAHFDYVSCLSSIEQFGKNNQIKHTFEDGKNRIMFFVRNPK